MIALREVEGTDAPFAAMCVALETADLPTSDLFDHSAHYFALGTSAFGGLVRFGNVGLLRSIVVAKEKRGKGMGAAILNGLLGQAHELDLQQVWLLTTTADQFFSKRGFERVPRGKAPDAIAGTTQFKQLCPDSAVLMRRSLSHD